MAPHREVCTPGGRIAISGSRRQTLLVAAAARPHAGEPLEDLQANFDRASETVGRVVRADYLIGELPVSFRFAGRTLHERLTPAFAHLAVATSDERAPSLTVNFWDSASAGSDPPPRPPDTRSHAPGSVYHFHEPPHRGVFQAELDALSVFDAGRGEAWYWVADAGDLPAWERACPIRQILFWWLASQGYLLVHGAAIGTAAGGALVVGPGGAGKSTVALACLDSDLLYAGDDYVAVRLDPPRVASLYSSGKLDPPHLRQRLPHLASLLVGDEPAPEPGEKTIVYVHERLPGRTAAGFPLVAVLVPALRPEQQNTRVGALSRPAAFAALAPSTMLQLHTAGAEEFAMLSGLITRVPCYSLAVGSDPRAIPEAISELLSTA
jgi:hypothetical protein